MDAAKVLPDGSRVAWGYRKGGGPEQKRFAMAADPRLLAAAEKVGIVHYLNHNYRRCPAVRLAKRLIEEGELGRLYHWRSTYQQDWLADPGTPMRGQLKQEFAGGGPHIDLGSHSVDLARFLVGEIQSVSCLQTRFVKDRPQPEGGEAEVTVDDASQFIGRFKNGALCNLEATRFALGRKNNIVFEINGSKGSLCFDFEDMNRLKFFDNTNDGDRQGSRDILVTQPGGTHPFVGQWWPPGHIIGYEHTFVHTVADFVNACVKRKAVQPTFEDGLRNQRVLEAVEKSAKSRKWVKV